MSTYRSPRDRMTPPMMEGSTWVAGGRGEGEQGCVTGQRGRAWAASGQQRRCIRGGLARSPVAAQWVSKISTSSGQAPGAFQHRASRHGARLPLPPTHHLLQGQLLPGLQQRLQAILDLLDLLRAQALRSDGAAAGIRAGQSKQQRRAPCVAGSKTAVLHNSLSRCKRTATPASVAPQVSGKAAELKSGQQQGTYSAAPRRW